MFDTSLEQGGIVSKVGIYPKFPAFQANVIGSYSHLWRILHLFTISNEDVVSFRCWWDNASL